MSEPLPPRPNLEHLRKSAKAALKLHKQHDPETLALLRLLPRFRDASQAEILDAKLSLQEVQHALALRYGFTSWNGLKRHVESVSGEARVEESPSPEEVFAYYVREDVSQVLWEMSRRRVLRFHYRTDTDIRVPHAKAECVSLHCLKSIDEFRDRVSSILGRAAPSPIPFYPFFGMGTAVNAPDNPKQCIGWDLRFEVDLDWLSSFRALTPVVAVLEHFGLPVLVKYSGHRSLHVVLPAEAFPSAMRSRPVHEEWMRSFAAIGALLCRFSPALSKTMLGLAKDMLLTAPYSLHRYHGRVSLPLTLSQSMGFIPERARVAAFQGVSWEVSALDRPAEAMDAFLDIVRKSEANTDTVLALAENVFRGRRWASFAKDSVPGSVQGRPVLAALMVGLPGVNCRFASAPLAPKVRQRLRLALDVIDRPETKSIKLLRAIRPIAWDPAAAADARLPIADALERWVLGGMEGALKHLIQVVLEGRFANPVVFSVRALSFLPEPPQQVLRLVAEEWARIPKAPEPVQLFLALALGELIPRDKDALRILVAGRAEPAPDVLMQLLAEVGPWVTEERPDLAVATLIVSFGLDAVTDPAYVQHVVKNVFGEGRGKFEFALKQVRKHLDNGAAHQGRPS